MSSGGRHQSSNPGERTPRTEESSRLGGGAGSDGGNPIPGGASADIGALFPGAGSDAAGVLRIPFGPDAGFLQALSGSDSATPAYITVNPDGTVGAEFSGHIEAEGLDLLASNSLVPPEDRKVRWLRESDGTLVVQIFGIQDDTNNLSRAGIHLANADNPTVRRAGVQMAADDTFGAVSNVQAFADNDPAAGAWVVTLINGSGQSAFAQRYSGALQSTSDNRFNFGVSAVATPGAATFFDVVVTHGLGKTPTIVIANPDHGNYHCAVVAKGATQFTVRCTETRAISTDPGDFQLNWIAIG